MITIDWNAQMVRSNGPKGYRIVRAALQLAARKYANRGVHSASFPKGECLVIT
jgi:hypothetical protein